MGPDSRSGFLGLPDWVLDSLRGLRASAEVLGAGTEALVASTFPAGCRGRRPKSRPVFGFDHPKANRCMTNSCRDMEAPSLSGACRLHICYGHYSTQLHSGLPNTKLQLHSVFL